MNKKITKLARLLILLLPMVFISLKGKFSDLKIYSNTMNYDNWIFADEEHKFWDSRYNGEYNVAFNLIKDKDIFFDVGANFGIYTNTFIQRLNNLKVFAFEPVPLVFLFLKKNIQKIGLSDHMLLLKHWKDFKNNIGLQKLEVINKSLLDEEKLENAFNNQVYLVNRAVSDTEGPAIFNFHHGRPATGGLDASNVKLPEINVLKVTIDLFCQHRGISKINFLKIDTEGHDYYVLKGAEDMLRNQNIDFIQFEYMAGCKNANWNLQKAYKYLTDLNYTLFKIVADGIVLVDEWRPSLENYRYANFLAVSSNFYE